MIFWILVALIVIITFCVFVGQWDDSYGSPFLAGFFTLFVGSVIGFLIFLACGSWIPYNTDLVREDTYQLKAIGNNSAIEGRSYFLGGGYIKDKRVLNFISQRDGGAIHVERAYANDSTIFEGSENATVIVRHYDHVNGWVSPWPLGDTDLYEFRIPAGSVVESYSLDNK